MLISLLYHIHPIRSHCFKHNTPILFLSCRIRIVCFINQSYTVILQKTQYVFPNENAQIILLACALSKKTAVHSSHCPSGRYLRSKSKLPFFQFSLLATRNTIWETVIMNFHMKTVLNGGVHKHSFVLYHLSILNTGSIRTFLPTSLSTCLKWIKWMKLWKFFFRQIPASWCDQLYESVNKVTTRKSSVLCRT